MYFGYYDSQSKEYKITNPKTPTSWINYLGTNRYCALISANAGGFSFLKTPKDGRFTRFRYQSVPMDRPGKYLYINDGKKKWSASWQPVGNNSVKYTTSHGMGYTKIEAKEKEIFSEVTYFVPIEEEMEIWDMKIVNKSKKQKKITVTAYTEFAFWNTMLDLVDFQYTLNMAKVYSYKEKATVLYSMLSGSKEKKVYFTWNQKADAICNNREAFLGEYNDESNPNFVFKKSKNSSDFKVGGQPAAALQKEIVLKPGETKYITVLMGINSNIDRVVEIKDVFTKRKQIEKEKEKIKNYWDIKQNKMQIRFPDPVIETMINDLNLYQSYTTFNWSRSASMYESGTYRDGLGYRDSCQDALAIIAIDSKRVRKRLLDLAEGLYTDGSAAHTYQPLTGVGSGGHDYSDDHLWLPFTVSAYIRETGDVKILQKKINYINNRDLQETLYQHIDRIFAYAFKKRGPHGLSLGLHADWNDCLNLESGESVWTTELFYKAIVDYMEVLKFYNEIADLKKYEKYRASIKKAFEKYAWDGDWFLRGFTGDGRPIGSKKSPQGKIYLNSNTWAIFSELATSGQAKKAMNSVHKKLFSKYGLKLLDPPYKKMDLAIGAITVYPQGMKENAGIFSHTNPWAVISAAMIKDKENAMLYYNTLIPLRYEGESELRKTEPYVYTQFIAGPDSPNFGEAKNSWLTGTASWNYYGFTHYVLGIRPYFNSLIIDPQISQKYKSFSVKREFQGKLYTIDVSFGNEYSLKIDSKEKDYNGGLVHVKSSKKECKVEICMKNERK